MTADEVRFFERGFQESSDTTKRVRTTPTRAAVKKHSRRHCGRPVKIRCAVPCYRAEVKAGSRNKGGRLSFGRGDVRWNKILLPLMTVYLAGSLYTLCVV